MTEHLTSEDLTDRANNHSEVQSDIQSTWLNHELKPSFQSKVTDSIVMFQEQYLKRQF